MRTREVVVRSAIGALVAAAGLAQGQDRHWVGGADFSWNNPLNWTPADVPNTFAENAIIDAGGMYQVLLSGGVALGSLTLTQGQGQLGLVPGAGLQLGGNVSNASTIVLNTTGTASDTWLQLVANSVFSGTGALVLNAHPSNANTGRVAYYAGGETLTNTSTHTIRGNGIIQVGLTNEGTVDADQTGKALTISVGTKGNSGTMRASNGGVLQLAASIANTTDGRIIADGGTVELYGVTIGGGQVSGVNGAHVAVVGNNTTLAGVDTAGEIHVVPGHGLNLGASFTNTGTITVNPDGVATDTWLIATGSFAVEGAGQVVLNAHPSNANTGAIGWYSGNEVITNGASHTIRGTGRIAPTLVNEGTILADQNAKSLFLTSNTKTNNNLMKAQNGGGLEVMCAVTQGPSGRLVADTASLVNLYDMTLTSGRVQAINGGLAQVAGNATLLNVNVEGPMHHLPGRTLYGAGTLSIADTLTLNPTGTASDTWLTAIGNLSLTGGGQIVLNAHASNMNTAGISRYAGNEIITNAAGNTIRGTGRVYAALVNDGVVNADQDSKLLYLDGGVKTNNNLFTATHNATLQFATTVNQGASGLIVGDGATVNFGDMTLTSGVARAINGGVLQAVGNPTLVSVSLEGPFNVLNGHACSVAGTLGNAGRITVNPAGVASDTWLIAISSLPLNGSGEIVLNAHASNMNTAGLAHYAGNEVVTNTSTHTIRGTGRIVAQVVNEGTIVADQPGKSLLINTRPVTNNGTIRAVNGAYLDTSVAIGGPGQILAQSANVRFWGGAITGQHISSTGMGIVGIYGATLFGDVTFDGLVDVQPGVSMQIGGTGITNNAVIRVNPISQATDTNMAVMTSVRLGGTGQVVLNANPSNHNTGCIGWYAGNEVLTNGAAHTIGGSGMIYPTLVSEGTLSPGTSDGAGALLGSGRGWTLANTSVVSIDLFGASSFDRIVTSGPIALGGELQVRHASAFPGRRGDTFVILQGSSVTGRFAHVPPHVGVTYTPTQVVLLDACVADMDDGTMTGMPDGGVDINDLLYFVAQYELGTLAADLDDGSMTGTPDQGVTIDDLLYFLARYEGGC